MKTKVTLLLALLTLSLTGCSSASVSPYDPYSTWEGETQNVYAGDKQDFHLEGFYPSDYGQIETPVLKDDGSYFVEYTKQVNYEYTNLFTTVKGRFAEFTYINIKAKGTPGKGIAFRLYCGEEEDENHNVLGSSFTFSLNEEYSIHSLKFRGTLKTRADLLKKVCIFPEIGNAGSASSFSYTDIWFSSTLPADSTLENPGVDSGDPSVTVNRWSTDAWTQYALYNSSSNTGVSYSKPGEWAFIQKDIEIKDEDNGLFFTFENLLGNNDEPSVTVIHFLLKGDVSGHVSEGVEYEYDVYYEGAIYTYDLTKDDEVQPDENGLTTLEVSLESAIEA